MKSDDKSGKLKMKFCQSCDNEHERTWASEATGFRVQRSTSDFGEGYPWTCLLALMKSGVSFNDISSDLARMFFEIVRSCYKSELPANTHDDEHSA